MKVYFDGFALGEKRLIKKVFNTALRVVACITGADKRARYFVSVECVDKAEIAELNLQYRQIDRPTDVLSFPACEPNGILNFDKSGIIYEKGCICLGDIAICREIMAEQAAEYGHGERRELAFLALHGLLHLMGFDHETEPEAKIMEQTAEEILNKCKVTRLRVGDN